MTKINGGTFLLWQLETFRRASFARMSSRNRIQTVPYCSLNVSADFVPKSSTKNQDSEAFDELQKLEGPDMALEVREDETKAQSNAQ